MGGRWINTSTAEKYIYLTFDDGPHPESTPELLKILSEYQARASFFCTGENAEKYPGIFEMIVEKGHAIGLHGYGHLNGFWTDTKKYIPDLKKAAGIIPSELFRPPYGRLSPMQYLKLKNNFRIYYWDILFRDYHPRFNPELALQQAKRHIKPGTIIAMHDKPANIKNTKVLLTLVLESLHKSGLKPMKMIHPDA
jgi:peptidoglycan-N-acetylglucosamine deacetylase